MLEKHNLTSQIFEEVKAYLEEKGLLLTGGSIVDGTIIHAPSSTKNKDKKRDSEMSSIQKGTPWHFGMKAHISVDVQSGLIHTVGVTTAKTHDAKVTDQLIRDDDKAIFGDKGYVSDKLKKSSTRSGRLLGGS